MMPGSAAAVGRRSPAGAAGLGADGIRVPDPEGPPEPAIAQPPGRLPDIRVSEAVRRAESARRAPAGLENRPVGRPELGGDRGRPAKVELQMVVGVIADLVAGAGGRARPLGEPDRES